MMHEWRQMTLGELCQEGGGSVQTGPFGSQLHAYDYVASGVPSVMPQNIGDNFILNDGIAQITESDAERLSKYRLEVGDIIYSRRGDVEKRSLVRVENEGWLCGTGCLRVRLGKDSTHNSAFVSYQLGTEEAKKWIVRHAVGATMPNLNTSILSSVPLRIPNRSYQQAIADVLGALDDKIAANTRLARTTDEYLSALFASMVSAATHTTALGEVAEVNTVTVKPPQDGQLRYIDIASVKVGWHETPELIDWADAPSRARRGVRQGDTIWSTVRPNRRSHSLNLADDPMLVASTGLAVLSPRTVGFAYLYEVSKRAEFTAHLENVAEGSAYPAVRAERFHAAPVPMLPDETRQTFEGIAAPMREQGHSLKLGTEILAATRNALLQPLMAGQLRIKHAEALVSAAV